MTTKGANGRLPWFPCYPEKLLNALGQMKPDQKIVYVVVLLRIYEVGGPCLDTIDALATRCGLNRRRIAEALDALFKAGKLARVIDGIMNPFAEAVLSKRLRISTERARAGAAGSQRAAENRKENQRRLPANGTANRRQTLYSSSSLSNSKLDSESKGIKELELLPLEDSQSSRVSESEIPSLAKWKFDEFWRQYPHKVGKRAAVKAFDAARKRGGSFVDLMGGLLRYAAKDDDRHWCNPATFLNQERWLDEPAANGGKRRDETIDEQTVRLVEQAQRLEAERRAERAGRAF